MLTGRDFVVICELFTKIWRPVMRSNVENVKKRFRRLVLWARTVLSVFVFSNARNAPTRIVRGTTEIDTKKPLVPTPQRRAGSLLLAAATANNNVTRAPAKSRQRRVEEEAVVVVSTCGLADVSGLKNRNGVSK